MPSVSRLERAGTEVIKMDVKQTPLHGTILQQNPMAGSSFPFLSIPGSFYGKPFPLNIGKDDLSRHTMLIGATGCGKTNVFCHMVSQIKKQMTENDVMIIFDAKGDYYDLFASPNDLVIGSGRMFSSRTEKWNLFKEVIADGWDDKSTFLNVQEMTWSIFRDSIDNSKDPFFPNAARDLFAAILLCMISEGKKDLSYRKQWLFNSELKRALDESTIFDIQKMIESHPSQAAVLSYIGDPTSGQALGVYAEMLSTLRKILTGCFDDKGMFSMRSFVRRKGARTLFIEYDLSLGNTLAPLYSLLFDLALKEALGREKSQGNVYFICDEFRLIPRLQHMDDAVNLGRSLGVKVIAGLQSISQFEEAYGESRAKNLLAGFSSVFAFRANDSCTRDYIVNLHGKNVILEQYRTLSNSIHEERFEAHVVEDWDLKELKVGEAVISFPFGKPFKYQFDLFRQ